MADREEFQKKLAELLAKAAAQGNRMTQEELAAFFRDENLTEEQMELVVEFLMAQKIEVAGYTGHASEKAGEEDPRASLTEQEKAYVAEYLQDISNMDVTNEQEAIKVHTTGAFIGDLIQEGSLSLMMAMSEAEGEPVEEEILEKVRMDMQMTLESQSETKRQEDKMVQKVSDLDETIRNMKEEYGRKVSVDEVADRMQISEDDVADILKLAGEEVEEEEE